MLAEVNDRILPSLPCVRSIHPFPRRSAPVFKRFLRHERMLALVIKYMLFQGTFKRIGIDSERRMTFARF